MSKPILYGFPPSPPVRACLLTSAAIGLDIDFQEVNLLKGEHLSENYLKKNPQHSIPTLEINGKFLCDSHAITAYLVGKYAKNDSLYPKDLFQRGLVDQRLHFDSSILFPRLRALTGPVIRRESGIIPKNLVDALYEAYDMMEKFLNQTNYIAGNNVTIADFSCVATMTATIIFAPLSSDKYPKINEWIKKMEKLPYYEEKCGKGATMLSQFVNKTLAELQA